jgi:hypothetical protein
MKTHLEKLAHKREHLAQACAEFEVACTAHEKHCENMVYETEEEALRHKLQIEHCDLEAAQAWATLALIDAFTEHLHTHHSVPR